MISRWLLRFRNENIILSQALSCYPGSLATFPFMCDDPGTERELGPLLKQPRRHHLPNVPVEHQFPQETEGRAMLWASLMHVAVAELHYIRAIPDVWFCLSLNLPLLLDFKPLGRWDRMETCCIQGCWKADNFTNTKTDESRCMRSSWRNNASGFVLTSDHVEKGYCPFLFQMLDMTWPCITGISV